jgi:hypothetical protein
MPKEQNIDFLSIIKEVFDPVFKEFGLLINNELAWDGRGESSVMVSNKDVDLIFYVGISPLFYYCSVSIRPTKEKGDPQGLDVAAIAKAKEPTYKRRPMGAQTREEAKKMFEIEKEDLLKYCRDFLVGDLSSWSKISKIVAES